MIFSENRYPLFRIMLERQAKDGRGRSHAGNHRIKDATGRRKQNGHRTDRRNGSKPLISPENSVVWHQPGNRILTFMKPGGSRL
jgi:hypothetical protein